MGKSLGLGPPGQQGPKWAREPSDPWQQSGEPQADAIWRWRLASVVASANPSSASNPSPRPGGCQSCSHKPSLASSIAPRAVGRAQTGCSRVQGEAKGPGTYSSCSRPGAAPHLPSPLPTSPASPSPASCTSSCGSTGLGAVAVHSRQQLGPRASQRPSAGAKSSRFEQSKAAAGSVTPWDCCQLSATGMDQPRGPLGLGAPWGTNSPSSHCRESSTQTWPMHRMPLDLPVPGDLGSPPWQGQEQPRLATDQPPPRASRLGLLPSLSPAALALETPTQLTAGDAGGTGRGHGTLYCGAGLCSSGCAELGRCREGRGDQGDPHQPCHPQRHFGVPEESGSKPVPARPVLPSLSHSQSPPAHSLDAC